MKRPHMAETEIEIDKLREQWRRDDEADRAMRCQQCRYHVEATSYERHHLWRDFAHAAETLPPDIRPATHQRRIRWDQIARGFSTIIGRLAAMPVAITITWDKLRDVTIAFWEPTSLVVDHRMIEAWLAVKLPHAKAGPDPSNFGHLVGDLLDERTT